MYSAYKNLVISTVGLSRFNRLGSSFSSRTGMSSLGCVINFSRYLVLWLVISALTVGICRSVCTYNGIRYVPWGVDDRSEDFVLEPLLDFNV